LTIDRRRRPNETRPPDLAATPDALDLPLLKIPSTDLISRLGPLVASALVLLLLWGPAPAGAQQGPSSSDQQSPKRLVILNVPGGGTEHLRASLAQLKTFEFKGQGWFVKQIRSRAIKPKGIMSRSEDLAWLMTQAEMDYILYLAPADESTYTVNLVEQSTGKPGLQTTVDRTKDGLSKAGARLIGQEVEDYLAPDEPEPTPEQKADSEPAEPDEVVEQAEEDTEKKREQARRHWLWASGRFRLFKRDLTVAGSNNAVLSYASKYYPGFELDVEFYPLGPSNPDWATFGLLVDFNQGFESVNIESNGGDVQKINISQTSIEGGPIFRLENPFKRDGSLLRPRIRFKVAVRHTAYAVDKNDRLPSTSMTSLIAGALLSQPVLFDGFAAEAELEITPVAFFGRGGGLFGTSSLSHAFATRVGVKYAFTRAVRIVGGYRFRLNHSKFQGTGSSDFVDSEAFELVQGIDVGIQYEY
jgi:hypothetical protein